jgi:hypothetical protein
LLFHDASNRIHHKKYFRVQMHVQNLLRPMHPVHPEEYFQSFLRHILNCYLSHSVRAP